jgi:hypothetical protein
LATVDDTLTINLLDYRAIFYASKHLLRANIEIRMQSFANVARGTGLAPNDAAPVLI